MTAEVREDSDATLAAVDLAELLDEIAKAQGLGSRGKQYACPSTDHGGQTGKSPPVSLSTRPTGVGVWKCHGCEAGGTAVDALIASGRARDVAEAFAQLRGDRPEVAPPEPLRCDIPAAILGRIGERKGWTGPTLARLGIGWDGRRFTFPIVDEHGQHLGHVRYLPNAEAKGQRKMLADRGVARQLFPPPESLGGDEVWVVEGEPDAVSMTELGFRAVGVPGTESWKAPWARRFERFREAVVVPDCDDAGRALARRVAADLAAVGVVARVLDIGENRTDKHDVGDEVAAASPAERRALVDIWRRAVQGTTPVRPEQAMLEQAATRAASVGLPLTLRDAADVVAAASAEVAAVWGEHPKVVWAKGEPFMIAGATGTGKTTLAQQVVLRRVGLLRTPLLDAMVEASPRPLLYLAIDRDKQAARSLRRMTESLPRGRMMWHSDLGEYRPTREPPARFVDWLRYHDVATLVVDSLYGLISSGKTEALDWWTALLRELSAVDVEVLVLHHFRKGGADDGSSPLIDRVYGGGQVTWSMGSVLAIAGEPGDEEVEAYHVKQPAKVCGPWTLKHDHEKGVTAAEKHPTPLEYLRHVGRATMDEICEACRREPKGRFMRRYLEKSVTAGELVKEGDVYVVADPAYSSSRGMDF